MSDRKVVLKMVMSLDGFVTSPDGTHEWMFEWFGEDSSERSLRALELGVSMKAVLCKELGPPERLVVDLRHAGAGGATRQGAGRGDGVLRGWRVRAEGGTLRGPLPR